MFMIIFLMLDLYSLIILARVLLSWFPNIDPYSPPVQFVYAITEPVLAPIRTFLRQQFPDMGMFDFSPLVVIIGIAVFRQLLIMAF